MNRGSFCLWTARAIPKPRTSAAFILRIPPPTPPREGSSRSAPDSHSRLMFRAGWLPNLPLPILSVRLIKAGPHRTAPEGLGFGPSGAFRAVFAPEGTSFGPSGSPRYRWSGGGSYPCGIRAFSRTDRKILPNPCEFLAFSRTGGGQSAHSECDVFCNDLTINILR